MGKRIFFSHGMQIYGQPLERKAIGFICKCFPGYQVFNPADLESELKDTMSIISRCIVELRQCELLIAIEYRDCIGKGVLRELEYAKKYGIDRLLIRIDNSGCFKLFRIEKIQVVNVKDYIRYARISQVLPI
jgi:hypothetical protein